MVSACSMAMSDPASIAGSTSGIVTLRAVIQKPPPRIADASSRSVGTRSSAFVTSVKT